MIKKYLRGIEVKDAEKPLRVKLGELDIKEGVMGDPDNCAFAMSLKHALKIDVAIILKNKAFIQATDSKGKKLPFLNIYSVSSHSKKFIENFDDGEKRIPNQVFYFNIPSKTQSINYVRKEVQINYDHSKPTVEPKIRKKAKIRDNWRSGMGKIRYELVEV